ncbi:MAG: hypothetical protein ACRDZT_08565 [Acidimicrobiales bacterium]
MTLEAMIYGRPAPPSIWTARLCEWRCRHLLDAGFDTPLATELAEIHDLDLHALMDLVEHGWQPRLAARLLEPLSSSVP